MIWVSRVSYWAAILFAAWFFCAVYTVHGAATCVSTGNTDHAEGLAMVVCAALEPVKVEVEQKPDAEFHVEIELTKSQAVEFREKEEELSETLTGLCVVLGARIFRARALRWEMRDPEGTLVVEFTCEEVL